MPSNKSFLRRMEIIDTCFRRTYRRWTVEKLLQTVNERLQLKDIPGISKRTLYGDLHAMQHEFRAPVEKYKYGIEICYRYADSNYSIMQSGLLKEEVQCLHLVTNILRKKNEQELVQQLESFLDRYDF